MRFNTARILPAILLVWLTSLSTALSQYQPWAVQWLQHAYNPCAGRQYLGVTNLYAGTNIVFSKVGDCDYRINLTGGSPMPPGGGVWYTDGTNIWWTNNIPGQVQIGDSSGMHIKLYTDGRSLFESNITCKTLISTKDFAASGNIVGGPSAVFYGNGSGLTNLPCCTNGAYTGSFTGDGSGLTNIPATNFVGQITLANLPSGVLTNNWNGPRMTITNSSLLVTGAQYIALSNGAANVLMTNGTITSSGNIVITSGKFGIGTNPPFAILDVKGTGSTAGRFQCPSGQYAGFQFWDSNPGNSWAVGHAFAQTSSADLVFSFGNNGTEVIKATISSTGSGGFNNNVIATNGVKLMVKPSFTTNFTCTTNLQTYLCNGTNQVVTLPNAAYVPNVIYRFAVTNGWAKVIITNATGAQTVRDGTSFSFTQVGIGSPSFFSDGAHWWSAARTKVVMPNAQFSCSTNITMTAANTAYPVTFNSIDFDNSQGIALLAGTNGLASKIVITNLGQYEFTPSLVINYSGAHTVRMWFRSNDTNIPNSCTMILGAATDIHVMTVPFLVNVTEPTAYEMWVQSSSATPSASFIEGAAASGNYPATPSVICPVKRISDPWP